MLSYAIGNKKSSELPLFRKQWKMFKQGDIFLGDKGFCSYFDIANLEKQGFYIVTTLLDAKQYPAEQIADLYFKGWDVELFFRDIKTTMGMDILRCRTPEMIRKEILMHFIAYNCVR